MSEQDRSLAQMDEGDSERHHIAQSLMQQAIDAVGLGAEGRNIVDVEAELVEALAARGIGEQPPRWLNAVASSLAAGNRYVEDARQA